jgi:hypothetical protein
MAEHRARGRAVYDHTNDEPRPSGRRRRQVADWGVGEEMFDHLPGRRFERGRDIPRGRVADGRRTVVIGDEDAVPPLEEASPPDVEEYASREDAMRARAEHEALWGADEPFAPPAEAAGEPVRDADDAAPDADEPARGRAGDAIGGRRTVKITGRPGPLAAPRPARRRPPRTMSERLGGRPDRAAAWAFALGMLLILIAILTSQL